MRILQLPGLHSAQTTNISSSEKKLKKKSNQSLDPFLWPGQTILNQVSLADLKNASRAVVSCSSCHRAESPSGEIATLLAPARTMGNSGFLLGIHQVISYVPIAFRIVAFSSVLEVCWRNSGTSNHLFAFQLRLSFLRFFLPRGLLGVLQRCCSEYTKSLSPSSCVSLLCFSLLSKGLLGVTQVLCSEYTK